MWGCCSIPHKCRCLYPSSFVLCKSIWNSVEFLLFDSKKYFKLKMKKCKWVGLAWLPSGFEMDSRPSFLCSEQAGLNSRLWSHASWSVISQSSFFMIQIYRFYKMCMLLSLFIETSYFSYLISYTNGMIIVQNEWHIHSSQLYSLLWMCSLYHILSFLPLTDTQKKLQKNKVTCVTWNSVMGLQTAGNG